MRTSKPSVPSPWARACAPAWLSLVLLALPGCALQPPSTPADSAWQAELERWPASDALLLEIATKHFHSIETLETQNTDRLDFHDVAVWAFRAALEAAYAAGVAAAAKR